MPNPIVFMFSGQGSHYYHMGRELYEHNQHFRKMMLLGDNIASDLMGSSIIDQVYNESFKKNDLFNRTLYTHPAIFLVEYALARIVMDMGIEPDYVLDTSLGGFTASVIAGVLTFEAALAAVIEQAKVIENLCSQGGMIAVLHSPEIYYENPLFYENLEMVGINFPSHFVVSGKTQSINLVRNFLKEQKISFQLLAVSHAFHSSLIDTAAGTYKHYLKKLILQDPKISYISACYADVLPSIPQFYYWEFVRAPIQFQMTIQRLEEKGPYIYIDLGPSGTLATFVKYNLNRASTSKSIPTLVPYGADLKILERLKIVVG